MGVGVGRCVMETESERGKGEEPVMEQVNERSGVRAHCSCEALSMLQCVLFSVCDCVWMIGSLVMRGSKNMFLLCDREQVRKLCLTGVCVLYD